MPGLLIGFGCQKEPVLITKEFEDSCWGITDTLFYEVQASSQLQGKYIYVDFLEEYPYRNLYLKVILSHPSGWGTDTLLEAVMIDETGYWMLEKKGNEYSYIYPYQLPSPPEPLTSYFLSVTQYMRDSSLCDVSSIGIVHLPEYENQDN